MRRRSLAIRLAAGALLASLVALVAAGLIISGLLRTFVEDSYGRTLDANMLALMGNIAVDDTLGRPVLRIDAPDPRFNQPFSGWYWTIADESGVLFRSGSLWSGDIAEGQARVTGPQGEVLFSRSRSFTAPGATNALRVLATAPRSALDADTGRVVWPLVIALVVLGGSLVLAQLVQLRFALRPLRQVGEDIGRIRSGAIDVLPDHAYRELSPIIAEMNGLITHNRTMLDRARQHVANLAHALKTPLAVIGTELDRSPSAPGRDRAIADAAGRMNRHVAHHLGRARMAAASGLVHARADVGLVVADLLPVFRGVYADKGLTFTLDIAPGIGFAGERQDLEEMLGNLLDNGAKWARTTIAITAQAHGENRLCILVEDDGAGMNTAQMQEAGTRGRRFDESQPGSGFGLAIVRDIAELYGGVLAMAPGSLGGLCVSLELPRSG